MRSRTRSPWIRTTCRRRIYGSALERAVNRRRRAARARALGLGVRAHRSRSRRIKPRPDECRRLRGRRSRDAFADAEPSGQLRKHSRPLAEAMLKRRKRHSRNSMPSRPAIPGARQSPPRSSNRLCSKRLRQHRRQLRIPSINPRTSPVAHPLRHRAKRPSWRAHRWPLRRAPALPRNPQYQWA